jgi:hypothetical protein
MLRKIIGQRGKRLVTWKWRRQHNEKLYELYSIPNTGVIKSRRMRWAGHVARMGERKGAWQPGEKISLGTLRHRWDDNIKMYLQETESGARGMDRAGSG